MTRRITELEGLRGLLAWWVVVGHCLGYSGYAPEALPFVLKFVRQGVLAVDVFIILSGFVISYLLDRTRIGYGAFVLRRIFRLLPVLLICIGLGFVVHRFVWMQAVALQPWPEGREDMISHWFDTENNLGWHVLLHATMLHGVPPREWLLYASGALLDPAWSISLEWQFYLVAPLMLAAVRTRDWRFAAVAIPFAFCPPIAARVGTWDFPSFLPLKLPLFWLGMVSYQFWSDGPRTFCRSPLALGSLVFIVALFPLWGALPP